MILAAFFYNIIMKTACLGRIRDKLCEAVAPVDVLIMASGPMPWVG